jgi:hypothetical protein
VRLPGNIAAVPGPLKLHPYQRAIADAIADPKVERISVLKSARIGFRREREPPRVTRYDSPPNRSV